MSLARRATISLDWQHKDVTRDLVPHLLALTYTDNLTGSADDLSLEFEDREGLWSGDWRPVFGDFVVARIAAEPWLTRVRDRRLGRFAHDKISLSGPPKTARITAVSAPMATGLRRRKRTQPWNGVTLKTIAGDIAKRSGLALDWTGEEGVAYKRREQKDKSDLEFLREACDEVGRCLKVTEDKIVIFDEEARDAAKSVGQLDLHGGHVLGWAFDADDSGRYGNCHLKFYDPHKGKVTEGQFPDQYTTREGYAALGLDPDGQTLEVRLPAENKGHAVDICKGKLRAANRFATSGRLTTIGDPGLVAGVTFDLVNAFGFDGKFIITKATHTPVGGYTCALEVRRCIGGY